MRTGSGWPRAVWARPQDSRTGRGTAAQIWVAVRCLATAPRPGERLHLPAGPGADLIAPSARPRPTARWRRRRVRLGNSVFWRRSQSDRAGLVFDWKVVACLMSSVPRARLLISTIWASLRARTTSRADSAATEDRDRDDVVIPGQPGQQQRIPAIGLDPVPSRTPQLRGRRDLTLVTCLQKGPPLARTLPGPSHRSPGPGHATSCTNATIWPATGHRPLDSWSRVEHDRPHRALRDQPGPSGPTRTAGARIACWVCRPVERLRADESSNYP